MLKSLDYVGAGSILYCPVRGVIAACETFSAIVERPVSSVLGARMDDLTHPADAATNGKLIEWALATGQSFVMQKRYVLRDGSSRWVENRYTVLVTSDDNSLISMISRPTDPPRAEIAPNPANAGYVEEMAAELAGLARRCNMFTTGDLLSLAARAAGDEALN